MTEETNDARAENVSLEDVLTESHDSRRLSSP